MSRSRRRPEITTINAGGFGTHQVVLEEENVGNYPGLLTWLADEIMPAFGRYVAETTGIIPSVVRVDCIPHKGGYALYEVEERPCGLGILHHLSALLNEPNLFENCKIRQDMLVVHTASRSKDGVLLTDDAEVPDFSFIKINDEEEASRAIEQKQKISSEITEAVSQGRKIIFRYKLSEEVNRFRAMFGHLIPKENLFYPFAEGDKSWMVREGHGLAYIPDAQEIPWATATGTGPVQKALLTGHCMKFAQDGIRSVTFKPSRGARSFGVRSFNPSEKRQVQKVGEWMRQVPGGGVLQETAQWRCKFYGERLLTVLRMYLCRSDETWLIPTVCGFKMMETEKEANIVHGTETAVTVPLVYR